MLGAEATGGHIGAMSAADFDDPARRAFLRRTLIEAVRELTYLASRLGQEYFLWELMPTPREFPHTPQESLDLMKEANAEAAVPVRICFDLGHTCSYDLKKPVDPHAWLEKLPTSWARRPHCVRSWASRRRVAAKCRSAVRR